jgi:hypothetical protein
MATKPRKSPQPKPPAITPEAYNAYLSELHLGSVRLVNLAASLHRAPLDGEKLDFDLQFRFGQGDPDDNEDEVLLIVAYKIDVKGEDGAIVANMEADYAVECTAPGPPPPGFLEMFGPMNLSRLVYPFFREQVAGLTAKMELPTLFVPLNVFGGKRAKAREQKKE